MLVRIIKGKVPIDQQIYVDDIPVFNVDFSDVDSDLWALHWDSETQKGEIEWATNERQNQSVTSEKEIDLAIGVPLQTMLDRRQKVINDAKAKEEAETAAREDID